LSVRQTATEEAAVLVNAAEPAVPIQVSPAQVQWSPNTDAGLSTPPASPAAPAIGFATPQSGETVDSDGVHQRFRTLENIYDTTEEIQHFEYSGVCYIAAEEPRSVDDALKEVCWRKAMQTEMDSIQENQTWELSVLPANHKAIGLKWVFKVKKDPDGNITKYKARLVAKGYAQREGWILRKSLLQWQEWRQSGC